ncbi:MAG: hypothetical protein KGI27_14525, partial [Thaumarchaeota archaeon]|nr:hypothetical protein [Nitrososphaerota archaeon]
FMLEKYKSISKNDVPIPLLLEDGSFLIAVSYDGGKAADFRYTLDKPTISTPSIDISYCNCTGWLEDGSHYYSLKKDTQAWQFGNHTVYSYAGLTDAKGIPLGFYRFEFYQNGYHVIFNSISSFDQGMKMTLDTFFNGTKLSDIEQTSIK